MIGDIIVLNVAERKLCEYIAKVRDLENKQAGVENQKRSSRSDFEVNRQGYGAELSFASMFNVYPDFSTTLKSKRFKTDGHDAVLPNGTRIDVKSQRSAYKGLFLHPVHDMRGNEIVYHNCDLFCYFSGDFPRYTFAGFVAVSVMMREKNKGRYFSRDQYGFPSGDLLELDQLL